MAQIVLTTTADELGNFSVTLPVAVNSGQKTTVSATKDGVSRSIEIYAPSGIMGGGPFSISGDGFNFPANIGEVTFNEEISGAIDARIFQYSSSASAGTWFAGTATGLHIRGAVTSLGLSCFNGWPNAVVLTLPDSLESIGNTCFSGWSKLAEFKAPSGLKTIGASAFYRCTSMSSIDFSSATQLQEIGSQAFSDNTSVTSELELPETLVSLGASSFAGCKFSKIDLSLCQLLTTIPQAAFQNSNNASGCEVLLPPLLTEIGNDAFKGSSLTQITFPQTLTAIGSGSFHSSNLEALVLPASVASIGSGCFQSCTSLKSISFDGSSSLTQLPSYAFRDAAIDHALVIPEGITSVGSYALAGLSSCPSITIPSTVTSFGTYALSGNSGLNELVMLPTAPPSINASNTLQNLPSSCIIKVPLSSEAAYKAASGWSAKSSQIIGV